MTERKIDDPELVKRVLGLCLTLMESGMNWSEFIVFCEAQEWDYEAIVTDDDAENETPFVAIVARELRKRLPLPK